MNLPNLSITGIPISYYIHKVCRSAHDFRDRGLSDLFSGLINDLRYNHIIMRVRYLRYDYTTDVHILQYDKRGKNTNDRFN